MQGFRLGLVPEVQPPILVAALREGMLRLAGREGDGAIINWLSADDVTKVVPHVHAGGADKEIVCRIFVAPSEDADTVRAAAKYRDRDVPERARLCRVPSMARARRCAAADVGRVEGRRPQTGSR